jgi:hypothetical protein
MASYFSQESKEEEDRYKREAFTVIACQVCGISIEDDHFDGCSLDTLQPVAIRPEVQAQPQAPKAIRLESFCAYSRWTYWNAERIKIVMRLAKQKPTRFRENVEYLSSRANMTPEDFLKKMHPYDFCRKVLYLLPNQCGHIQYIGRPWWNTQ